MTSTAITQKQHIVFIQSPFKLVPANSIAEVADKFGRNAILSSNEIRSIIGYKPVDDERADELRNNNLNAQEGEEFPVVSEDGGSNTTEYSVRQEEADGRSDVGKYFMDQLLANK